MKSAASGKPASTANAAGSEAAALDAAGAALGAIGMLAFAVVFWLLVESSVAAPSSAHRWPGCGLGGSLVRAAQMRSVRRARTSEENNGPAIRGAAPVDRQARQAAVDAFE